MKWSWSAALALVLVIGASCSVDEPGPGLQPLESPDATSPTAGICDDLQPGDTAVFRLNLDTPEPRCGKVTAEQTLRVINATESPVMVVLVGVDYPIAPGAGFTFAPTFGAIWEPGVHLLHTSAYAGSAGPEIWLISEH